MTDIEKRYCVYALFLGILNSFMTMIVTFGIIPILMLMISSESTLNSNFIVRLVDIFPSIGRDLFIFMIPFLYTCLLFLRARVFILNNKLSSNLIVKCEKRLSNHLLSGVFYSQYLWFSTQNSHKMRQIIQAFTSLWAKRFVGGGIKIINDLSLAGFTLLFVIFTSPLSALIVFLLIIPFTLVVYKYLNLKVISIAAEQRELSLKSNKIISESLQGIKELKIYGQASYALEKFKYFSARLSTLAVKTQLLESLPRLIIETTVIFFFILFALFVNLSQTTYTNLSETLLVFGLAAFRLIPIVSTLSGNLIRLNSTLPTIQTIIEFHKQADLNNESRLIHLETEKNLAWNHLKLTNVSLNYHNSAHSVRATVQSIDNVFSGIRDINVVIEKGKKYAVIGSSGSGKSTFVDIISGLALPTNGSIFLDSNELISESLSNWRRQISYVTQSPFMYDASLIYNVTFQNIEDFDELRYLNALRVAEISHLNYIDDSSKTIGEFGRHLSGGERQRVAIARAIYRPFNLLIMDEATTALDRPTEKKILLNLLNENQMTLINITHSLLEINAYDKVIYIENGELIGFDHHLSLHAKCIKYKALYDLITSEHT